MELIVTQTEDDFTRLTFKINNNDSIYVEIRNPINDKSVEMMLRMLIDKINIRRNKND
jgi:hypothetical protein